MRVVALVPIKLNSQRLPHKNILPIAGHPLCWHVCNTLAKITEIDEVYVYCSDKDVINYLPEGVTLKLRNKKLDENHVKGFEIYNSFISEVDADIYVLAHTTSPFIKKSSIENALRRVIEGENDSAFSAEKFQTFAWYNNKTINYDLNDVPRTQDILPVWIETSAFYIFKKEIFEKHNRRIGFKPYIQEVKGIEVVDIDEKEDYDYACNLSKLINLESLQ